MEKLRELQDATSNTKVKYLEYISAVKQQREAAQALVEATEEVISLPHIRVDDFEIDG